MSSLRVNEITNLNSNGAVSFPEGVVLVSNQEIQNVTINAGIITATAFSGSGVGVTNIPAASLGLAISVISTI